MNTIIHLYRALIALSKVKFNNRVLKARALFWVIKVIFPEGVRFFDHNYRPYLTTTELTDNDHKFLSQTRNLFQKKASKSLYLQICIADINLILDRNNNNQDELKEILLSTINMEPRQAPLRFIGMSPKAKKLLINNRKLAPDSANAALIETYSLLESNDLKPFLMSGTLLGLIREKKFLSHDMDIDIGLNGKNSFEKVKSLCELSGFFKSISVDQDMVIKLCHQNGVMIDIFFHWNDAGKSLHGSTYLLWSNTPFDYLSETLYDNIYRIPKNYDLYLTENYGDWVTPNSNFNILYDTPNVSINSTPDGLAYLCLNVALLHNTGDTKKLRYIHKMINNQGFM